MGLNGIMSSALSALQTNTAALRVVSNNIANVNTPDYARRQVNLQTLAGGPEVAGVDISDIERVVDQFLSQENLSATSSSSRYDAQSSTFDQISALLGSPGDGTALTSKLSDIFAALGQAALSPTTPSSQNNVVNAMNSLASSISDMSDALNGLQTQIDSQVSTAVTSVNTLIKQIFDLNNQIKLADAQGETDTAYLDQRDTAMSALAKQIDIRTVPQGDGTMLVSTQDGINLVGSSYAQLAYTSGEDGSSASISIQDTDPQTGGAIGNAVAFEPHLSGGAIKGLVEMRDGTLTSLENELGAFAQGVALAFNRVNNANSAYPPPQSLAGRNTGMLSADSMNFAGKTSIILTDASGVKQHVVSIDFGTSAAPAYNISVDGGAAVTFDGTIGGFASALSGLVDPTDATNTAGSLGLKADFTDGRLTLSTTNGDGVVVADPDSNNPSARGGVGFSQFFGLNDLFQSSVPSILTTGISGSDSVGLAAAGSLKLTISGPSGETLKTVSVAVGAGDTFSSFVANLNTQLAGYASFTLNSDGSLTTTMNSALPGATLQVTADTTSRGSTGVSLSQLFGIGSDYMAQEAVGFTVNPAILNQPSLIAFAKPDLTDAQVVGSGDSTGLMALQNLATAQQTFSKAGALGSQTTNLVNYASSFYQDFATRSATAQTNQTTQDDRLSEAQSRMASNSGVSLDEELSNMMMYQQAYNAGARMLTIVGQLYDTLLQIV